MTGRMPRDGVIVEIKGGFYLREKPFDLTLVDSGTEEVPIIYRARRQEAVYLLGGKVIDNWKPVTDKSILERLDEAARGKVLQADLKAIGITDLGEVNENRPELFFQGKPMTLARWPNDGFVKITGLVDPDTTDSKGHQGSKTGKFMYEGERPRRWVGEKDPWVDGYWYWGWADEYQRIASIDITRRVLEVAPPYHFYGYRVGQWFYVLNMLSELDQPGEWYLDRGAGILYFWPPAPIENGAAIVSIIPAMVIMKDVSHVTLQGLTIEAVRGTAIRISGGTNGRINACTIRNVGGSAVDIKGGSNHRVTNCDLYFLGESGINLQGGNRETLDPSHHIAENNHIHHYGRWKRMYSRGIYISGVGIRAAHNLIHDAPHQGIYFSGNDHVIEFNEIHHVCLESNDAGAIYAGRDWTMRGTTIRYNYLHHIAGFQQRGAIGIYLDDMFSGTEIFGNIFYRVTSAAFIGGGRDCLIENNIFVDCTPAVYVDARALGLDMAEEWIKEGREKGTLLGIRFNRSPYSIRYPKLPNMLNEEPTAPRGNIISHNICAGGKWENIDNRARPFIEMRDNIINEDPDFLWSQRKNPAALTIQNFQPQDDSPAWKVGFQLIPVDRIGMHR